MIIWCHDIDFKKTFWMEFDEQVCLSISNFQILLLIFLFNVINNLKSHFSN
jgi:hypothetical protein